MSCNYKTETEKSDIHDDKSHVQLATPNQHVSKTRNFCCDYNLLHSTNIARNIYIHKASFLKNGDGLKLVLEVAI